MLSVQQISEFESNGYLMIPQLLSPNEVIKLADEARHILARAGSATSSANEKQPQLHNILSADAAATAPVNGRLSLHVEHIFRHSSQFHRLIRDSRVTRSVQNLYGPNLRLLDDQLYWKPASVGGSTYIHRDSDFFGPLRMATVWLPLCDVAQDNGCLWAIPRSHQHDKPLSGLSRRTEPPTGVPPDQRPFDFFYKVDLTKALFVPLPMRAGDALVLHRDVIHCSFDVRSTRERLSYLIEYFVAEDYDRFRNSCSGLFDYHERWRYMEPIQSSGEREQL